MNSETANEQAAAFAASLHAEHGVDRDAWITDAWHRALGRAPDDAERTEALAFLESQSLDRLCLLLFNLNEFIYVD